MYLERSIARRLLAVSKLYPTVLVTGVRQTGKTELVRHSFPNHDWVLIDRPQLITEARADPTLFLQNHPRPCILDEVQRIPEIFLEIKAIVDTDPSPKAGFVLTGSQPLALMKNVSESLAGRVGIIELFGMTPSEISQISDRPHTLSDWISNPPIGRKFPWPSTPSEAVFRGSFPAMALVQHSVDEETVTQRLSDYVQTFLTRDLRDLSSISDLGRFERFLRFVANSSGRLLNASDLSRDSGIAQSTVQDWLSILEAAYLIKLIPGYHSTLMKREVKRPKLVLCDSGLMMHLLGYRNIKLMKESPNFGAAFETMGIQAVLALLNDEGARVPAYHWRSGEKSEVDLVIELNPETIVPIEFKFGSNPSSEDLSAIRKFRQATKTSSPGVVVSTFEECYWIAKDILHLPLSGL